jgi:hypothetical protein
VAGTGGVMVRSGHTFTNVSKIDDDVIKYQIDGGSGNVQLASGDALYHGNIQTIKKDITLLSKSLPFLGHSGNITIMTGFATRRGGNILLTGGDVAVPKLQHRTEHEDDHHDLSSLKPPLISGSIHLRAGSIIEYDDNDLNNIDLYNSGGGGGGGGSSGHRSSFGTNGIGGDVDIAPGRGSEEAVNDYLTDEELKAQANLLNKGNKVPMKRRHGKLVLRDHLLKERIVVNSRLILF